MTTPIFDVVLVLYCLLASIAVIVLYVQGNRWWNNVIGRALVIKSAVITLVMLNTTISVFDPTLIGRQLRTVLEFVLIAVALTYQAFSYARARYVVRRLRKFDHAKQATPSV